MNANIHLQFRIYFLIYNLMTLSDKKAFGCTSTTVQHKKTGDSVTIQFQARTVNTENAALSVTNQILSHNDSTLFTAVYTNNVKKYISSCNGCTFTGNADTGNLSVRLDNLNTASWGTYKHSIQESSRNVKGCVLVYILGVPEKPTIEADKNNVNTGQTIKLSCRSLSTTNPRDTNLSLQYKWIVDNAENPMDTRYVYSQSRNTLTINNVGKEDGHKRFTCKVTETGFGVSGLTSTDSDNYMISVLYGPDSSTTTLSPPDTSYSREEKSTLGDITCTADCNPECNYKWIKPDNTVISNNGVLSLGSLSRNDTDKYTCTVSYASTTKSVTKSVTIDVLYPTTVTEFSVQGQDSTKTVNEHEDVQFICAVDSNPASTIKILFNNELLQEWSNTKRLLYSRHSVACEYTGVYTCEGSNSYGQPSRRNVTLFVRCIPRPLQQIQPNITSKLHDPVTLTFEVIAYPEPGPTGYAWHKESSMRWIPLLSNKHLRISSKGLQTNMTILNVSQLDFGQYRATATNINGSYEQYLFLVEEDGQKQQASSCVKSVERTDNTGLIVGLCFGLFSVIFFVYATYVTIKLRRITVKKEAQSNEEANKQSTYINVTEGETSRNINDTSENHADSVNIYTDLVQYSKDDKTTYDVIQKK